MDKMYMMEEQYDSDFENLDENVNAPTDEKATDTEVAVQNTADELPTVHENTHENDNIGDLLKDGDTEREHENNDEMMWSDEIENEDNSVVKQEDEQPTAENMASDTGDANEQDITSTINENASENDDSYLNVSGDDIKNISNENVDNSSEISDAGPQSLGGAPQDAMEDDGDLFSSTDGKDLIEENNNAIPVDECNKDVAQDERVIEGQDQETNHIDAESTLADQQSEKDTMIGLIHTNTHLEKESQEMKEKMTEMQTKCDNLETDMQKITEENTLQKEEIKRLEHELNMAKFNEESKKELELSNQKIDDLQNHIKRMNTDSIQKSNRIQHLEDELQHIKEGVAAPRVNKSGACVIV